jgi:hypothetical protein
VRQIASGEQTPGEGVRVEVVLVYGGVGVEQPLIRGLMEILVIDIVEDKAEDDKVRHHVNTIDLKELEFLISRVARYASIDDFERV